MVKSVGENYGNYYAICVLHKSCTYSKFSTYLTFCLCSRQYLKILFFPLKIIIGGTFMISETTMQRLAFIRYLYKLGVSQSHQPEPLSSVSILTFHDSAELFLQLASEYLDKGKKNIDFMGYWEILAPKLENDGLTQKESMRRFNATRVALKHHGTLPSKIDIEAHRATITNFFEDNIPLVFGIDFSAISMVHLVVFEDTRNSLIEAINFLNKEDTGGDNYRQAINWIAISYQQLINAYYKKNSGPFGSIYDFRFGSGLKNFNLGSRDQNIAYVGQAIDEIGKRLETVGDIIKIILCGIDYKKYASFLAITPSVSQTMDKKYHTTPRYTSPPTKEQCKFCMDFVIESALHLQNL
jgi:hypothetical protein